ncbi:uncharacterized protein LOC143207245 [Lasioglossum baleicum]|uniref:uncharacterized protein LOC143207245 n=1 Tax=Lasioglossum baleicum TaxID=434251 RepID=UPI003FCD9CE5
MECFQQLAKSVGEFPHCKKSHITPAFLPVNLDTPSSSEQNRKESKRINGLSVFIGSTEQRILIKEQTQSTNELKDKSLPSQHVKEYKKLCKSIWSSTKRKPVFAGPIFFKKGDKVLFNFKHFVNPERIVEEYARVNFHNKPRFVKVNRKESAKSQSITNRERSDSDVEQHKTKQFSTREKLRTYPHSSEPGWRLNKPTGNFQKNVRRPITRVTATHNFVYEFNPFATSKTISPSAKIPKGSLNSSNVGQGDSHSNIHDHASTTLPKLQFRSGSASVNLEKEDFANCKKNTNLPNIKCQEAETNQRSMKNRRKRNLISDIDHEVEKVKSEWQSLRSHNGDWRSKTFMSSSTTKKLYDTLDDMTREIERIQKSYLDPKSNQFLQRGATKLLEASESAIQEKADKIKDALFPRTTTKSTNRKSIDNSTKHSLLPHGSYTNLSTEKYLGGRSLLTNKQCQRSKPVTRPSSKSTPNFKKGNLCDVLLKSQKSEIEDYLESYITNAEENFKNGESRSKQMIPSTDDITEIIKNLNVQSFDMFDVTNDEGSILDSVRKGKNIKEEICTQTTTHECAENIKEEFNTDRLSPKVNKKTLHSDSSVQAGTQAESNSFMEMSLQALNADIPENVLSRVLRSEFLKKDVSLKPM